MIFLIGCNSEEIRVESVDFNYNEITLDEAERIANEQGYALDLSDGFVPMREMRIEDINTLEAIKDVSKKSGYSKSKLESMSKNKVILEYQLEQKSKNNKDVFLSIVADEGEVIGAFLHYDSDENDVRDDIKPIDFKDDFK